MTSQNLVIHDNNWLRLPNIAEIREGGERERERERGGGGGGGGQLCCLHLDNLDFHKSNMISAVLEIDPLSLNYHPLNIRPKHQMLVSVVFQ